jgi:hypothetical protein
LINSQFTVQLQKVVVGLAQSVTVPPKDVWNSLQVIPSLQYLSPLHKSHSFPVSTSQLITNEIIKKIKANKIQGSRFASIMLFFNNPIFFIILLFLFELVLYPAPFSPFSLLPFLVV